MLWTLVAMAIAVVYVLVFVGLIREAFSWERLGQTVAKRVQRPQFRDALRDSFLDIGKEVYPVYLEELKSKFAEHEITMGLVTDKAAELVSAVGPAYYKEFRKVAEEMDLTDEFSDGMKDVADAIVPAYREELNRITPEVFAALNAMKGELVQDVAEMLKTSVRDVVRESLERNEDYIRQETGLTEEVVKEKLEHVVLSAEKALVGMVKVRTDKYQADLEAIQAMLDQIPDASEKDLERLQEEIGRVTLHLAKLKIPDSESRLEW